MIIELRSLLELQQICYYLSGRVMIYWSFLSVFKQSLQTNASPKVSLDTVIVFQLRPWLASYLTAASEEYFTWIRTSLDLFGATGLTRHQEADKTLIFPMWMRSHPSGDTFRLNRTNSSRLTRSDIRSGAISRRFILASLTCRLSLDCHSRLCSWLFGQIQKAPVFVWQCDRFRQGEPEMSKCHTFFSVHFFVSSGRDRTRRVDAPHPADRTLLHRFIQDGKRPRVVFYKCFKSGMLHVKVQKCLFSG